MNLLHTLLGKIAPSGSRANREAHAAHEATLGRVGSESRLRSVGNNTPISSTHEGPHRQSRR